MSVFPRSARSSPRASRAARLPAALTRIPPSPAIAVTALLLAVVVGHLFADGHTKYAVGLVLGICYAPLVLLNLPLAFAVYIAVLFLKNVTALSVAPNSMGVLVLLGWLGMLMNRPGRTGVLREQSRLLCAVALFAIWLSLSVLWASNSYEAANGVQVWLTAMLAFVIALSALRTQRHIKVVAAAFIVGAVVSVCYGIATGALSATATTLSETAVQGRFTGGGGDPNDQAAGFLVAMFLCVGMWSLTRGKAARAGLLLAFTSVAVGFFATQSRGGFIALAFAAITGFVLLPRQRKRLLGLAGAAGLGFGALALASPVGVARITDIGGGTSGRSDLWTVAWRIFVNHPWLGIGLANFQSVEPGYTLKSGPLNRADLIAEAPHLVHNVYLQMLTECGVIGFALFMLVLVACMRASWLAARRFDAIGRVGYGDLARAVLMAEIAMLSALFFISDGEDFRLWVLLGLGPALLSLARRTKPVHETTTTGELPPPAPGLSRDGRRRLLAIE
jgi:O-antigen ligase